MSRSRVENRTDLTAALTALTDRLTAPDLTLAEANRVRAELAEVLGRLRSAGWPDASATEPRCLGLPVVPAGGCLRAAG